MFVFVERGKSEYPEKIPSEQSKEPPDSTHLWRRVRESNPDHIGGRRALSPLRHPCSPILFTRGTERKPLAYEMPTGIAWSILHMRTSMQTVKLVTEQERLQTWPPSWLHQQIVSPWRSSQLPLGFVSDLGRFYIKIKPRSQRQSVKKQATIKISHCTKLR